MLASYFKFQENRTNLRIETGAGITTFMTMAYIIFVQPAVLSGQMFGMDTGMDFGAVMMATCLAGALATFIMGIYANYPIAQAPGMGENFFFVFSVIPAAATLIATREWQGAPQPGRSPSGVVFIAGVIFLILSLLKVRQYLIDAISPSLKNGIAVGIGLFISFIGLKNAGIIVGSSGTLVTMTGSIAHANVLVFGIGFIVMIIFQVRKIRGAILWGIAAGLIVALILKKTTFTGFVSSPPALTPTFFKMDVLHALAFKLWPLIIIFLFMDIFDTIGTLIGVGEQAGFIKDNKLPRAGKALISDAVGTVTGAVMGTSTVTSFIESTAGIS